MRKKDKTEDVGRARHITLGEKILLGLVTFFAILNLFPLYWLVSNTFKYSHEITKMPPDWFPKHFNIQHYIDIFVTTDASRWLLNSFIVSIVGTVLIVLVSSMAAYAFAKLDFYGKNVLFTFFVGTLMIPKECYTVPLFIFMRDLKLINTYASMILPMVALPFGTFMLKSFFEAIPNELRESAKIDGAGEWRIFVQIILPMAKAGLGALFILRFVAVWNDYLWQMLMAKSSDMKTMMVGIASLMEENKPDMGRKLTGAAVSAFPMIVAFLSFQKYFTRGISVGAVKG